VRLSKEKHENSYQHRSICIDRSLQLFRYCGSKQSRCADHAFG